MPTLSIEDVPDDLYVRLIARAAKHQRSLAHEVLHLLERELNDPVAAHPAALRAHLRDPRMALQTVWVTATDIAAARARARTTA